MLLTLQGVKAGYGATSVLHSIDIDLDGGELVSLVGANGAGKSTIVKAISGVLMPSAGRILLDGEDIGSLATPERISRGIVHVPEGRQIFAGMTVEENLRLGTYRCRSHHDSDRLDFVFSIFPLLKSRLRDIGGNLSGGQQQMLAIARGLMSRPRILMLDEPSLGLAPLLVNEIFELVLRLRQEGLTILLVEQNARSALQISDRGYVIEGGHVRLSGPAAQLLRSTLVAESYLGGSQTEDPRSGKSQDMAARLRACLA